MKIQIKATGIELTPAIRDYVEKKLEKGLIIWNSITHDSKK